MECGRWDIGFGLREGGREGRKVGVECASRRSLREAREGSGRRELVFVLMGKLEQGGRLYINFVPLWDRARYEQMM